MNRIILGVTAVALYFAAANCLVALHVPLDQAVLGGQFFRFGKSNAYIFYMRPPYSTADTAGNPERSKLQLYEDGVPLGPAHAGHDTINELGLGRYSHWYNGTQLIVFSSSDNSDPNTNGRVYRFTDPTIVDPYEAQRTR